MEWYEAEVQALERARAKYPPDWHPAVFYGSSSIRLWHSLPSDLESPDALNLGFGGSTLEACAHFFDRLVPPLGPRSLVVYAGDNDLGDGQPPDRVQESFDALAARCSARLPGIPFGFISIKPSPARTGLMPAMRRLNEWIRHRMATIPGGYFIDIFAGMLDGRGLPNERLFLDDGLHLSRAGYDLWARLLQPYRNRIFIADSFSGNGDSLTLR